MKASHILILLYLAIALLYAIFGGESYQPFSYRLGAGLAWPMIAINAFFPSLGKLITSLGILAFVLFLMFGVKK